MSWKDDAIDQHIAPSLQLLLNETPDGFRNIGLASFFADGDSGLSIWYADSDGKIRGVPNSMDLIDEIKANISMFRDIFVSHGENWKTLVVVYDMNNQFSIDFGYAHHDGWIDEFMDKLRYK